MQTLQNGIKVPTNGDGYDLTDDLATMGASTNVIINVTNEAQRDALLNKYVGMTVRRLDFRGTTEWWDGSGWVSKRGITYTPIWTGVLDFGTGGELTGTYWVDGDLVRVEARAKFGTDGALGANPVYCPLPPGYPLAGPLRTLGTGSHVTSAGVIRPLHVFAGSATTASIWAPPPPTSTSTNVVTPGQAGYPTGNGDTMDINIAYRTSAV